MPAIMARAAQKKMTQIKGGIEMIDLYEKIAELDSAENEMGVSPLEYVALDCARK